MFGVAYIVVVAVIAAATGARAAWVAMPPLVITVALFESGYAHAGAVSSGFWALSGACLLINSEYVSGLLYGISGAVYILFYFGASNATLSIVPVVSDAAFILGLAVGAGPSLIALVRGYFRRGVRWSDLSKTRQNMEIDTVLVWGKK